MGAASDSENTGLVGGESDTRHVAALHHVVPKAAIPKDSILIFFDEPELDSHEAHLP